MSVSSTNLSGNNVTAFNRYRRLVAERARAEAEAQKAKAEAEVEAKKTTKPEPPKKRAAKPEVSHEPFSDVADDAAESEPKDGE
jgi:hypothetical protein